MAISSDDFWEAKKGAWFFDAEGRVWLILEVLNIFILCLWVSCEGQKPRLIFWSEDPKIGVCGQSGDPIEALNNPKTFVPKLIVTKEGERRIIKKG